MIRKMTCIGALCAALLLPAASAGCRAQVAGQSGDAGTPGREWDLKTNLLMDATASANLGLEHPFARKWSWDLSAQYNPWEFGNGRKWKHWLVSPELRWWGREALGGFFVGLHAIGGEFNVNKVDFPFGLLPEASVRRHEGWFAGGGLGAGWRFNLSRRLAIELEAGAGGVYDAHDIYCPEDCGLKTGSDAGWRIVPTRAAVNLTWRFGAPRQARARKAAKAARPARRGKPHVPAPPRDTVRIRDTVLLACCPDSSNFRSETYVLRLQYRQGSAEIMGGLGDNRRQLAEFRDFADRIMRDPSNTVTRVTLTGWCSIEGTAKHNERLSLARADGVGEYLLGLWPELGEHMYVDGMGEDWDGLLRLVEDSGSPWTSEISRIIRGVGVYDGREKRLMDLRGGDPYRWMEREFFPILRRTVCVVEYVVRDE